MTKTPETEPRESGDDEEPQQDLDDLLVQQARQLARETATATLGTIDGEGYPYTSFVELIFDGDDAFWMLLSDLATHSTNIDADRRASLMLRDEASAADDEQDLQITRGTFVGTVEERDDRRQEIEADYLAAHPHAEQYIDFGDFNFYCLRVERIKIVAGFGRVGWVAVDRWRGDG